MTPTTAAEKAALRAETAAFYRGGFDRSASDERLFARFLALPQVEETISLLLFYGVGTEPATEKLFGSLCNMGKAIYLPRCLPGGRMEYRRYLGPDHLVPGAFVIPEPDDTCPAGTLDRIGLTLVPDLRCDRRGYRLGHGGGYYDRALADYRGFTVALCREALLLDTLPTEPHDIPVDLVVTENECLSPQCKARSGA